MPGVADKEVHYISALLGRRGRLPKPVKRRNWYVTKIVLFFICRQGYLYLVPLLERSLDEE